MYKIKNYYKEWYQPHAGFLVRNPLYPIEQFFNWTKLVDEHPEDNKEWLKKSLQEFYRQPIVKEALYIASPDLHEQLLLWLDDKIEKADKREKTELSLAKYMIRMCTRCTPYGLFASCSLGEINDNTSIELNNRSSIIRHGRIDMDYAGQALSHLLEKPEINQQLRFFPNSSLYPLGDNYRYVEHRFTLESGRSYHLVQIAKSIYLDKIIEAARAGLSARELAAIITDNEVSSEEALGFLNELISNQVLISDLEPNVTGKEYFKTLVKKLKQLDNTEEYVKHFENVNKEFEQIKTGTGDKNIFYGNIVSHLRNLEIPVHLKTLIQIDSYRPTLHCKINKRVCDDLLYESSLIQLLANSSEINDIFRDFKNAFMDRYEGQWIPLVEVLDTESGIGYGKFSTSGLEESPLIDKLPIGEGNNSYQTSSGSDVDNFKWQLYQEAITQQKTELIIDDATIERLSKSELKPNGLPDSVYLMSRIHASSAAEIDAGNYTVFIHPPAGPSGGNLLGRFCHLHPDIEALTNTILQQEEAHQPDAIFAEIVHLPESRIGNILMRPIMRNYEIPYLCGSTLDKDFQIPVTDLLVGIENGNVVLFSKKLKKRVIPRMTNAHNFSMTTLPVYQFLCDLQFQKMKSYGWSWGILDSRPFLPRVSYGKYIISKAKWTITKEDIKECEKKNDNEVLAIFKRIAQQRKLPRYLLLSQGDNELMLDLQNIYCIRLLQAEINKFHSCLLTETFDTIDQSWIKSEEGHYAGEFIFTFNKNSIAQTPVSKDASETRKQIEVQRYFPVGSEWLYVKIYCGTKTAEKVLCEAIKPLTETLLEEGIIDKFFFIRYMDSGNHIRVRFHHASHPDFWKTVIDRLQQMLQPFNDHHSIHNVQIETYQREIERYGLETIEDSENIFYHQSVSILNFISLLEGDEGEHYRWQIALKTLDIILDDFGYDLLRKRDLLKLLHESFSNEFNISGPQQKKISERFTSNKKLIYQLMNSEAEEDENMKMAIDLFRIGDESYKKSIANILHAPSVLNNPNVLNDLLASHLHMFINRMFISKQRKVELVLYDYLLKHYETKVAMQKNKNKAIPTV